jgi:hypothetical protein
LKREPRDATTIDGEVEVFTSPMRTRWALEEAAAAAAAAKEATE